MDLSSLSSFKTSVSKIGVKQVIRNFRLVPGSQDCLKCGGTMNLNYRENSIMNFRCTKRNCRSRKALRHNTIFGLARIRPELFLSVIVAWILKYPLCVIVKETNVGRTTVKHLISKFRELLTYWLLETSEQIGGFGETVEVDESAFGRRKYNRGRLRKVRWVIGGIDRQSKKCFLKIVDKRDSETLLTAIKEFVKPGTTVMTDMWKGYNSLAQNGYLHHTVNHSQNFVCPNNVNVHTQNIESHWSKIKRDMRRRIGRMSVSSFETYLVEYVWRNLFTSEKELFDDFMKAILYFYPQ